MERYGQAEWLEWSGLPVALNKARAGGWTVFKKLVELDCKEHRCPGTIEISLEELGERTGFDAETVGKILEALRKKKYLRCFMPENPEEEGLFEIRAPIETPLKPEEVAKRVSDPLLRNISAYRYATKPEEQATDEKKVQEVIDLYLNYLSQKMNTFILEQIEIVARRFELAEIRLTMERAARHNLRNMGWVLKELIRDHAKRTKEKKKSGFV